MKKINLLVDYKNNFGSSFLTPIYRSGMDKELLKKEFARHGWETRYIPFPAIDFRQDYSKEIFLYTSSEDEGGHYKDYIEDILLGLNLQGAFLVPEFKYFRAHHNKVFMEILRQLLGGEKTGNVATRAYGTLEDMEAHMPLQDFDKKSVLKSFSGSVSSSVFLAKNREQLISLAKRLSRSKHPAGDFRDLARVIRHKGYRKESRHRKRFIVQDFVEGLANDWKILVYGAKYYVLYRKTRAGDFRASGSGMFEYQRELPAGLLDFAEGLYNELDVPFISLDVGHDGRRFHLFEFQAVYFGNFTIEKSPFYFERDSQDWQIREKRSILEEEYASSVLSHIRKRWPDPG